MKMSDSSNMIEPPVGKAMLGTSNIEPNVLEKQLINSLDEDKVDDLSKRLFTLNNRRYGPIAGAYVVVCTKEGEQWCVGQLNADRAQLFPPLKHILAPPSLALLRFLLSVGFIHK